MAKRWLLSNEEEYEQENSEQRSSPNKRAQQRADDGTHDALNFLEAVGLLSLAQRSDWKFWCCTAELNVLLNCFQHTFTELRLLQAHSFSRCPKPAAFEKVAWACGCSDAAGLSSGELAGQHAHLAALRLVLEAGCSDCGEVCIDQITFLAPAWLGGWLAKWLPLGEGYPPGTPRRITLSVVQGYSGQPTPLRASAVYNIGRPQMTTAAPQKTIYIPCFMQ